MFPSLRAFALALALVAPAAAGQTITPVGTDATFDIATWNIEFFGVDGGDGIEKGPPVATQLQNVHAVISQAAIDLWAIQEIASPGTNADPQEPVTWEELLTDLADDGYAGILAPTLFGSIIRNGFIYDTSVFSDVSVQTPIAQTQFFGAKAPLELTATVTVGGESRRLHILTFHAVSSNTAEAHQNRKTAAGLLKDYVDGLIAEGELVILLGDFNDLLTKARWRLPLPNSGLPAQPSPYEPFLNDPDYVAATLPLELNAIPTFCGRNTPVKLCGGLLTIDHILQSASVPEPVEVRRYDFVLVPLHPYAETTSDHAPVFARYDFGTAARTGSAASAQTGPDRTGPGRLLSASPNPFRGATDLRFTLDAASAVRIEVFDVVGRQVFAAEGSFDAGDHAVPLAGEALAPGTYVVRLTAGDAVQTAVVVRRD